LEFNILARKFLKFANVGAVATIFQYILLMIFVEYLNVPKVPASIASFCFSAILNYSLNYHYTFSSNIPHISVLPKFVTTAIFGLLINTVIFYLVLELYPSLYIVAQVSATIVVLFWNFIINLIWSFREAS